MKKLLLVALFAWAVVGCGKKGPLIPPEAFQPAPIGNLQVVQKEDRLYVSWGAPTVDAAGRPLKALAGFRLYRREVLPPDQDCESCPDAYRLLKTVDLEYPQEVRRINNRYVFADSGLKIGTLYQYKVIAFNRDGTESAASNRARWKMALPPPAPRLQAVATPTGIQLSWEPGSTPGPDFVGYNLYRRRSDDISSLELLTPVPIKEQRFEDLQLERGVTYLYLVREMIGVGGESVEGAASNEVRAALTAPE